MPTFIVETDVNPAAERLADAVRAAGHRLIRWSPGDAIPVAADAIFMGSLTGCDGMPGVIGDPQRLRMSHWLPGVADIALNRDVRWATVGEVGAADIPWRRVFVRPDSAMKPFAGRVLDREQLSPGALDHGFYYDDLDLPIALAEARPIAREWRFVAVDRRLIASSAYVAEGRRTERDAPPPEAIRLAEIAAERAPEPGVVLDVCTLGDGTCHLVEFNLLSGSDLYGCDVAAVVAALAR